MVPYMDVLIHDADNRNAEKTKEKEIIGKKVKKRNGKKSQEAKQSPENVFPRFAVVFAACSKMMFQGDRALRVSFSV